MLGFAKCKNDIRVINIPSKHIKFSEYLYMYIWKRVGNWDGKNYPFLHWAFYFNDKKDINMERLWPISGILKFDLNPQSTILCSQMLEVIFVYAPIVFKSYRSLISTSLKILFRTMISLKNHLEVQKKFFCIKNIVIQPLEVQKPETGQKTGPTGKFY